MLVQGSPVLFRGATFLICLLLSELSAQAGSPVEGPAVAIRDFTATNGPESVLGKGLPDMLITDLVQMTEPCMVTVAEWRHRAEVIGEIEFQQSGNVDPAYAVASGQMVQPDIFVDGSITASGSNVNWTIKLTDAVTGEELGTLEGGTPGEQIFEAEQELAKQLHEELCKKRPGYQISGTMDEATITGIICGGLDKPFTASSPEVAGSWAFTPSGKESGTFSYTAQNVGGATGSGKGTYTIVSGAPGAKAIKLSGSGSIHSPFGTFSAPITETLPLTPIASCRRRGNR